MVFGVGHPVQGKKSKAQAAKRAETLRRLEKKEVEEAVADIVLQRVVTSRTNSEPNKSSHPMFKHLVSRAISEMPGDFLHRSSISKQTKGEQFANVVKEVLKHVKENEGQSSADAFVERELRNTSIKWRRPSTKAGSTLLGAYAIKVQKWKGKAQANALEKQLSGKLTFSMSREMKKSLSKKLSGKSSGKSLVTDDEEEDAGTPGSHPLSRI